MDALISGVALAALSAITYLAYKHPVAYERMYPALALIVIAVIIGIGGWNLGGSQTFIALLPFLEQSKEQLALKAHQAAQLPLWPFGAAIAVTVYLAFLRGLPSLLGEDKEPPNPEHKKKD